MLTNMIGSHNIAMVESQCHPFRLHTFVDSILCHHSVSAIVVKFMNLEL